VRSSTIVALALSGLGLLGLILTIAGHGNVRDFIAEEYRALPDERLDERAKPTKVYASTDTVTETARDIAKAHKPAERRTTPEGAFLRYSDDIVSILPMAAGASRILVDDDDTGYRRNYFFVGGFWGRYSGPSEGFRGGGPGTGK
jgi:hypothetical protein